LTNLWLLGGEIIRNVDLYGEYAIPALEKLRDSVGSDGGPYCRHLNSEYELESFDTTCRKLNKFLTKANIEDANKPVERDRAISRGFQAATSLKISVQVRKRSTVKPPGPSPFRSAMTDHQF
jgi:hypothetical protein